MSIGLLGINYMDGFAKTSIIYATKTTESLSVFQGVSFIWI
jgi:hypothetical protein